MAAPAAASRPASSVALHARFLRVIAGTEFKLKYADSVLGYVWSVAKPLALFSVLYLVFGEFFRIGAQYADYPLYLLIGIVLWFFFADAATTTMYSIVTRGALLRKLAFPRILVPMAATMTATITFAINLVVIIGFVAWERIVPRLEWLLVVPLLLELYLFTLGVALILSTLYVRFRDVAQVWELLVQLLFYATPIIYPVGFLPDWARAVALLNPFAQVMQDIRELILHRSPETAIFTAPEVLGSFGRVYPLAICALVLAAGIAIFKREEPWLAERV